MAARMTQLQDGSSLEKIKSWVRNGCPRHWHAVGGTGSGYARNKITLRRTCRGVRLRRSRRFALQRPWGLGTWPSVTPPAPFKAIAHFAALLFFEPTALGALF